MMVRATALCVPGRIPKTRIPPTRRRAKKRGSAGKHYWPNDSAGLAPLRQLGTHGQYRAVGLRGDAIGLGVRDIPSEAFPGFCTHHDQIGLAAFGDVQNPLDWVAAGYMKIHLAADLRTVP